MAFWELCREETDNCCVKWSNMSKHNRQKFLCVYKLNTVAIKLGQKLDPILCC